MKLLKKICIIAMIMFGLFGCSQTRIDWQIDPTVEMDYESVKTRISKVMDNRSFFFKDTPKNVALAYLESRKNMTGIDDKTITKIEKEIGKNFPLEFKTYLNHFGRQCSDLFSCGQDIEVKNLVAYQFWAKELLKSDNAEDFLGTNTIVFEFHQGYSFMFFAQEDNENMKIGLYVEGDMRPKVVYGSFNELLLKEVERIEKINKESQNSDGHFLTIKGSKISTEYPAKSSGIIPRIVGDEFPNESTKLKN